MSLSKDVLRDGRRRPAGGTNREEKPVGEKVKRDRAAGVGEVERTGGGRRVRVRADEARGAGRAVLRRLEMAEKVVMLEGYCQQEQRIDRHAHDRVDLGTAAPCCCTHPI